MGETLENHAARVLQSIRPGTPADAALRDYLAAVFGGTPSDDISAGITE